MNRTRRLQASGFRVIGFRVIGFRVIGFRVIGFRAIGPRVLTPESMPENGGKLPKIAIRGPRGGGAMASALFHKNNPVKKHIG